jgi:serine/threonine protein kinase
MTGETIAGRYRLLEPLGRGAMSSVWLAHDDELDRRVAVKLLAPRADRTRFEREARAAAALSHPNISALYDYGEADGKPYMVLEYLPGGSLEERLREPRPLADADALRIASELAAGLAHAHDRGLVHRDLKPANVLFDAEGRAKIADFGIARMGDAGTLTEAGTVLGTASYISPEQASGEPAGPASDVYSFGVIVFRMLTGRLPFVATNAMELVRMHRDDPPPAVSDLRRDAPSVLETIATAALAKDPAGRPADGAALGRLLQGGEPTEATQVLRRRPAPRRPRPAALVPLVTLALLLLAGGAVLAVVTTRSRGSDGGTVPPLSLPSVPTTATSATATTTAPTTTAATTTTAPTTTAEAKTTTAPTTTHAVTTAPVVTLPTTTATLPTTTVPATTTTAPTTTDTTAATTTTVTP